MNAPNSRFSYPPVDISIPRSTVELSHRVKGSYTAGLLYPLFWQEYLPGDTFQIDISSMLRMSTPIHPVMDDAFLDIFVFSCPNRLTWDHWKEFMGESSKDPYLNDVEYTVPQLMLPAGEGNPVVGFKSVADYLGVPGGSYPGSVSALPFRAFATIWNEWFRDQNLQYAIDVHTGDANEMMVGVDPGTGDQDDMIMKSWDRDYITETALGGALPPVNKYHDYFTSALKEPQKGEPVAIPINGFAPVYAIQGNNVTNLTDVADPLTWSYTQSGNPASPNALIGVKGIGTFSDSELMNPAGSKGITPNNLFANLGYNGDPLGEGLNAYATINDLTYAYAVQKLLYTDGVYGTRYREVIQGHFKTTPAETLLQVPEFLGGKRIRIGMNQVVQTSSTDSTSPQGNTAAYSLTTDRSDFVTKSFQEHGILMAVMCIRTAHSYSQGINRQFLRSDRYSYFWPELAHIPEVPIKKKEIYVTTWRQPADDRENETTFGFQEAWSEYRYLPDHIVGELATNYPYSLDSWHYGDHYNVAPTLSDQWIRETRLNVDRTLAVSSDLADQFIGDFYIRNVATRPIPVFSVPGLSRM